MGLSLFEQLSAREPSWSDERVVRALCEQLLDAGEVSPPVDVGLLASLCGIIGVEERPSGPTGMLVHRPSGWVASVLVLDGLERQRFTILHEAGHTLLPGFGRGGHFRCKGPRTREEQLCDIAAGELLLPRRFFLADLGDVPPGLEGVEALADMYEASVTATALRRVDLSAEPALLLVFRRAHKPSEDRMQSACEPRLRLAWSYAAGNWPYQRRHKSAPTGSAFARAWRGEHVNELGRVGQVLAGDPGRVSISARRYGDDVLALVGPVQQPAGALR